MRNAINARTRKRMMIQRSESRSQVRSEFSPAIEGLQEWLRLQLATPARLSRERRLFVRGALSDCAKP